MRRVVCLEIAIANGRGARLSAGHWIWGPDQRLTPNRRGQAMATSAMEDFRRDQIASQMFAMDRSNEQVKMRSCDECDLRWAESATTRSDRITNIRDENNDGLHII